MSGDDFGTRFRFVPSLRRGFGPADEFTEGTPDANARPTMGIDVAPEARKRPDDGGGWEEDDTSRRVDLHVYGPGDVRGIDDAQITRVEPEPETGNFPPNYFPFLEFDRPGLPWRFSPEAADDDGRTRPWLTLVTVEDTDAVSISVSGNRPCPVLELGSGVDLARQLPDLRESWAWAHAQLQDDTSRSDWAGWASDELTSVSNVTASRLLSPRNLEAETDYVACLVPTFEAGRLAGLGREPYPDESEGGNSSDSSSQDGNDSSSQNSTDSSDDGEDSRSLQFAWDVESPPPTPFELPLYHYWRFTAGAQGTFESLVTNLEPVELGENVGMKQVDVTDPGPDSLVPDENESTTHPVAGALYSAPAKAALTDYGKRGRLRTILNKPETLPAGDTGDYPIVGPPLYCKWHVGLEGIPPENLLDQHYDPQWFRDLNLGLRHRVAASVGGEVVKAHQDQLLSAAWKVVGDVREANKVTRNVQVSAAVGEAIERAGDSGVGDEVSEVGRLDPSARPWLIRSELDRIERLGGLGVDDVVDSPFGDGSIDPEEGTTQPQPGEQVVEEGPDTVGDREQVVGGDVVDPGQRISTGYALAGSDQPLLREADGTVPDGGTADESAIGAGTEGAALYTEYLRTFSEQPEASLQYQRLLRRDGPIARRGKFAPDHYDRTLERVRDRTLSELATLAEGLSAQMTAGPSQTPGDGSPPGGQGGDGNGDQGSGSGDNSGDGGSGGDQGTGRGGSTVGQGGGTGAFSGRLGGSRTAAASSLDTGVETVGVETPVQTESRLGESIPPAGATETADATTTALDERVPPGSLVGGAGLDRQWSDPGSPGADDGDASTVPSDGEPAASVAGLLSSLLDHATAARGRVRTARNDLGARRDPTDAVLAAYERAEPIAYGLDPLDRELSKAIADEDVAVAPALDHRRRGEALQALRDAYGSVLSTLTTVYAALETDDTLTDGGPTGDGGAVLPEDPSRSDLDDALATAEDDLERFRAELEALRSLVATRTRTTSLDLHVVEGDAPAFDPCSQSSVMPDTTELDQRVSAGGSRRYYSGHLGNWSSWIDGSEFVRNEDPVTEVMAAPEFPTPMWRPLKDYDEEFLLPGASDVPADSVGLVVQNREFIEAYMAGLSHELGRELLWRKYPTDRKGTYFRRFWNKGKGPAWEVPGQGVSVDETPSKDIEEIHDWDESALGSNAPGSDQDDGTEKVVLLVRGELFRRYPDANVYAAKARAVTGSDEDGEEIVEVKPITPERFAEHGESDEDLQFPTYRGRIDPDITFLGFDLTVSEVYPDDQNIRDVVEHGSVPEDGDDLGWYFVFEERPGETRFGLEVPVDDHTDGRPVGVATDDDPPFVPYDGGDPKPVDLEPVGWDDVSWAHLVGDTGDLDAVSYVPLHDSRPGQEGWTVPERTTDPQNDAKASDLKDSVGRAFDEGDVAEWKKNSAHMARISWRKPSRVSFHAMELLPDDPPREE